MTIVDVAARAGVWKSVVSPVLHGGTGCVSVEKRAAVEKPVQALGYRTNAAARALVEPRNRTVDVVLPDVCNSSLVAPGVLPARNELIAHGDAWDAALARATIGDHRDVLRRFVQGQSQDPKSL